jgi:Tfp pilus assembly PilM family ATPase
MSRFSLALTEAPPPDAAVEIGSRAVTAATLERRGGQPVVTAYAIEPLPDGALAPSLTAHNVQDRAAVAGALARALDHVGRPRRVGLILPDPAARVTLVRFEQVPARAQELDQLIRWQVRKAAPFSIDEAQVSYVDAGDHEFIVTLARRDVVEEYEGLLAAHGAHAGIVDIATFNVINTVLAGSAPPASDWLLINLAPDWASIGILRGPRLIFFRTRSAEADGTLADLVHQTAMYYEDRLQGSGFTRVVLCGGSADDTRRSLEERLGVAVAPVDLNAAATLADRITAPPSLVDTLAPVAGLLLRDREAAA